MPDLKAAYQEKSDEALRLVAPAAQPLLALLRTPGSDVARFERVRQLLDRYEPADLIGKTDHVTLLPNRMRFLSDFTILQASEGKTFLVLVTLADAKHFNDLLRALGHSYAEDFVRAGAARLADLLPAQTQLYHVSVLSFAFLAPDNAGGQPPSVVGAIVDAFRHSIVCQKIPVDTKAGVGLTPLTSATIEPSELLRATLAAAQDSRRTDDGWAWYNSKTDAAHQRAFRILTDLPAALAASDQLSLQFQPRVCMRERACLSAEALVRWRHPEMGVVSPAEFIALAEATALITPLTQWVLEHSLLAVANWQAQAPGLKVSVNVSPKNLEEPTFAAGLYDLAMRIGVDPALVELEFTEGMLAGSLQSMLQQVERLRQDGFEMAIDDFGSGYSNMSYLGKFPAKYLKIDQAFVRTLDDEPKYQVLVRSIIEMAHALGYKVVAEGIETRSAFALLSDWSCDEGQGYLMSRPLDAQAFMRWLATGGDGW